MASSSIVRTHLSRLCLLFGLIATTTFVSASHPNANVAHADRALSVAVPNVVGMSPNAARAELDRLGFRAVGSDEGVIRSQHPAAGTQAPVGTTVRYETTPPAAAAVPGRS